MNCKYYCSKCGEHYFRRYTNVNEKHDKCGEFAIIVWEDGGTGASDHADSRFADGGEHSAR